ncbi:alpha/beta fold hydrolase [Sphingomonas lutea]|uniref:Alpha/beta fold hydrolase n=1 Tax=Sphingomonas lutea TaxID=1045317 RepID=A0A7G9SGF8_9SPHN|nr:alpha/beta fold hydrolase [Sphingomonas lutea]QNN66933.1 alpha/beta fold hydrolase [Sphingomonas lutea]
MDVLSDILASLRLTGGVVIDASARGDWCMLSQFTEEDCAPFFPVPGHIIGYHYVRSGKLTARLEGHPPVEVPAGHVVMLPRNDPHLLYSREGLEPADIGDKIEILPSGLQRVTVSGDGEATEMFCGYLGVSTSHHPLLDSLPPILVLDVHESQETWLETSLRFMSQQEPSADLVARLAELFFAEAIRTYIAALPAGQGGWLRGLTDPAVSRALSIIHSRYAEDLDVEELAREAGVSRTVLGERFVELIGEPPMRYCAGWRMRIASIMLREGKDSTANIAYSVGFNSEAAFNRAFKREFGEPPATWRKRVEAEERAAVEAAAGKPLPPQQVRYCEASDGTRLAYSIVGEGRPLVKTANWLNHLVFDFESPIWKPWLREISAHFAFLRYDERGNGLSDWDTPQMSLDAFVDDLACVVDDAGFDRFDLFGISQGAPVSIAYAVRYPNRVRRLVLLGGYACGWRARADNEEISRREAMVTLTELGWGNDNPAYRQIFTNLYVPGAKPGQVHWYNELQRRSTSPENAAKLMRVLSALDVRDLLPQVRVPTLVLHARNDQAVPFTQGELLARDIPGAQFVPLDSANHILLGDEPAFRRFIHEMRGFLDD